MLANLLCPKHDRGDDSFGYRVLDSSFQLSFWCYLCVLSFRYAFFFSSFAAEPPLAEKACMFELLSAALVRPLNLEISVTANLASVCLHDAKHACMSLYLHLHLVC